MNLTFHEPLFTIERVRNLFLENLFSFKYLLPDIVKDLVQIVPLLLRIPLQLVDMGLDHEYLVLQLTLVFLGFESVLL